MELTLEQTRYDELALFLREMVGRFGDTAFTDKRRLLSLLSDRLTDARCEIKVVGAAIDERAFEALARARPEHFAMEIERLAAKLQDNLGIRADVAIPVVRACAYGLSVGRLPSQAAATGETARATAGAPRQNESWVGLSEAAALSINPTGAEQTQMTCGRRDSWAPSGWLR
jgi:hypothetical protein